MIYNFILLVMNKQMKQKEFFTKLFHNFKIKEKQNNKIKNYNNHLLIN